MQNGDVNERALDRLFRRFRDRGDGAALAAVFDATARELLDVAGHLLGDPAAAEDVVQETFLAAIRAASRFDASRSVKAWLYGILWREAARARRGAARRVEPDRLPERRVEEPVERLLAREVPEAVERALRGLPRRYREVLVPLVGEGRAPEEIARDLRRAPGTVRSQIHRGLERLRRALPKGFASASGLAFLPGGSGARVRGLEALRREVLRAAGLSPAAAAAAPAIALQVSLGAFLMSKTAILAGAALLAGVSLFSLREGLDGHGRGEVDQAFPGTSAGEVSGAPAADERAERSAAPAQDPRREAHPLAQADAAAVEGEAVVDPLARWLARFGEAPDDWRHGWKVAAEIAALPPDEALAIMTGVWPYLTVAVKEQALKPFVFGDGHPRALPLLDLAATDESLSVQGRAFHYLREYAFQDFANDHDAYLAWSALHRDRPLAEVLEQNARRFAGELRSLPPAELLERLRSLEGIDLDTGAPCGIDLAGEIRAAGGLAGLTACLQLEDPEAARLALSWSKRLQADEAWLRAFVLPALSSPDTTAPEVLDASIDALGRPDCGWARGALLGQLERLAALPPLAGEDETAPSIGIAYSAARALARIGDPAAIPAMIEILANDRSGRLDYAVGYFGLARLTGVRWQESFDADWWLEWWEKNGSRLSAEVRGAVIERKGR